MLIALMILVIGLTPAAFSLVMGMRSRQHLENSFLLAADYASQERFNRLPIRPRDPDEHYVEGMGLVIGDITCKLNARSPYIRCAANPFGPCDGCREYESKF